MTYEVFLTEKAQRDLIDIYEYIADNDSPEAADYVYENIDTVIQSLCDLPHRGVCPKEFLERGVTDFRELFFKPYRIIYEVEGSAVYVYLVADGRRNMSALLRRRLLAE